jgi:chromosomal replication initiation ATPase DnaA
MSTVEKEIGLFLSNVISVIDQKGVSGILKANKLLEKALGKKSEKSKDEIVESLKKYTCSIYKLSVSDIMRKHVRGDLQECKQICYCYMHLELDMTIREIARHFKTSVGVVMKAINTLRTYDEKIVCLKNFYENYNKVKIHLNTKNNL